MIKNTKKLVLGILAHVDAGKTTLAESMLYLTGSIRKLGRVDHKDAFLDTYELEKNRGITIFSKQAVFTSGDREVTLLDTPGHVDFSAEMERTLQILDYAVLVISGADGVQGHVETLWKLLKKYKIPTFLFINKMDQPGTDRGRLMEELQRRLDERCVDFTGCPGQEEFLENLAMCDEIVLDEYLKKGSISEKKITGLITQRKVFPCYFGSALKVQGVRELLDGVTSYTHCLDYPDEFGARVYKISRDDSGIRLTHLKVTGGCLKVKMLLTNRSGDIDKDPDGTAVWEEKADQIRIYSGSDYRMEKEVPAGTVCAVTGLSSTYSGQGLGFERHSEEIPVLEPVLTYQILFPEGTDQHRMLRRLRDLEEEEPLLHIVWNEELQEIHAQVMGEVQIEILKDLIRERYGVTAGFGSRKIVYKETIENTVEGVGHFEPLRHYAEVHLLMQPGDPGSGLVFSSSCSEDILDKNWQRLILTHLQEKSYRGVLTGSEITDMKITLLTGRSHIKHTEGGDFRQATYRAVRQGLMQAKSVLLEPYYAYRLEIPVDMLGRAISDVQRMGGSFSEPETQNDFSIITGEVPVSTMQNYQREVTAYTRGRGSLSLLVKGYKRCHNANEVIAKKSYDPDKDQENPSSSVFCAHGSGFLVPWNQVRDYMHIKTDDIGQDRSRNTGDSGDSLRSENAGKSLKLDRELKDIFERTYGTTRRKKNGYAKTIRTAGQREEKKNYGKEKEESRRPEYLLVDGYNIIFSWEELSDLAAYDLGAARSKLMDILSNYQGYKNNTLILVFDAYKVEGNAEKTMKYNDIYVVYTKEAETADQYIEKAVHRMEHRYNLTVATSDALEQIIIMGQGAIRMSAMELKEEIQTANIEISTTYLNRQPHSKNYLFDHLPKDLVELMEEIRLGKKNRKNNPQKKKK